MAPTCEGGCHCGAIRFRIQIERFEAVDCNCSICRMKGYVHLIVAPEAFELLTGIDALSTYSFNTGTARHHFCSHCGVAPYYRPRSHPDHFDVNVRCLDGDLLRRFDVRAFDGRNWEQNVDVLRDDSR